MLEDRRLEFSTWHGARRHRRVVRVSMEAITLVMVHPPGLERGPAYLPSPDALIPQRRLEYSGLRQSGQLADNCCGIR
jgi:hypothetical protein